MEVKVEGINNDYHRPAALTVEIYVDIYIQPLRKCPSLRLSSFYLYPCFSLFFLSFPYCSFVGGPTIKIFQGPVKW